MKMPQDISRQLISESNGEFEPTTKLLDLMETAINRDPAQRIGVIPPVTSETSTAGQGLTPYDTGERCEALPWIHYGTVVEEGTPAENFGKVDFDDAEGETVCTAYVEQQPDGTHVVHVLSHDEPDTVTVQFHEAD